MNTKKYTGLAIALAWPDTYCKQAGAWYDPFLNALGIAHNNFYKVGHAAVLLINKKTRECRYFDFGRYHTPYQKGRVRSMETDNELIINTKVVLSENNFKIKNYEEILTELQSSDVFHGSGDIFASYTPINFDKSYNKALALQKQSPMAYGPFVPKGSNCSRFVNSVIRAGKPKLLHALKLYLFCPLTPTPKTNVLALSFQTRKAKQFKEIKFSPPKLNHKHLKSTLAAPQKHPSVPEDAIWHGGEGAGSWFLLAAEKHLFKVCRYSVKGDLECKGYFKADKDATNILSENYTIDYLSNCKEINLKTKSGTIRLSKVSDKPLSARVQNAP
jgi:hypothetical protein